MNSRAQKYRRLLREAAKQLGTKPSDERAVHAATLRLAREQLQTKLIAGRDIDPGFLLRIDEALRQFMPAAEPPRVEVTFVEGITGICPKCKAEIHPYTPPDPPPSPTPPGPQTLIRDAEKPVAVAPTPASPTNVVPLKPRSIHDDPHAPPAICR